MDGVDALQQCFGFLAIFLVVFFLHLLLFFFVFHERVVHLQQFIFDDVGEYVRVD